MEKTKHEIANDLINKAITALVDAIKDDILQHDTPRGNEIKVTCYPVDHMGFGADKVFVFIVDDDDNISIYEGDEDGYNDEEFTLSDIEIGDLIDISNAILCGNIV